MSFNWFDVLVLVLFGVGAFRGRQRGISAEIVFMVEWLVIVIVGSLYYAPLARLIAGYTDISLLVANITAYLAIMVAVKVVFSWIRRIIGEKLMTSDLFGNSEYYLGIMAGAIRYTATILAVLALLNARYVSAEQFAAMAKMQQDNFGDISFPTFSSVQNDVFKRSFSGPFIRRHLSAQLIEQTPSDKKLNSKEPIKARRAQIGG